MPFCHTGFFDSDNTRLFYAEYTAPQPDAPVLFLLHGNGEEHGYFSRQIAALSSRFRLILPDTRGHGQSEHGSKPFCFSLFADDLLSLMNFLKIPKAHLLGFSDGGNTALTFALSYPQRVNSLILNGANLNPLGVKAFTQIPVVLEYGYRYLCSPFSKLQRQKSEILGLMVHHPHISADSLHHLCVPSLVIVGEKDMIRDNHSRLIADSIPDCRFVSIENSGHFCAADSSEQFNAEVLSFLSALL